jgi:hypothetical protein
VLSFSEVPNSNGFGGRYELHY